MKLIERKIIRSEWKFLHRKVSPLVGHNVWYTTIQIIWPIEQFNFALEAERMWDII